ncbi:islet cell autoantigen 1-like isoform X2 [Periophthalmus magnuspinnatus]|uniref:islet cell autoantigen 1-like isoform X2 n=1 Tax=Periophthalmus magnuspinnatus TaxID=409849 RepID=UPI002436BD21|nr:islet cell autoantigen 1-like isoform X2 [Periophthalmus magnuspinnatus]
MDGFMGDMLDDSSVMARMQKKFWKTKQVLIKATGKKEDEYVVASDADLDAKLEFFRSVQSTCTELLKVIERYQQRITRLSQEENELGLFLHFQGEHDKTKAGNMMNATSKALCTSAKQRMALCAPLHRLHQEVETFRRRAIQDTLLTVTRMERARTEYRGALLWMKDVSQELDPDTYKQMEKFRKVQSQVRGTKTQFEKLKNDVCQKVDMLGASRCNMLSHSLCTYQTTLLQFWERTAHSMSKIHEAFKGHVTYQFTTLKDLRDPLDLISESEEDKKEEALQRNTDSLVSLDDNKEPGSGSEADRTPSIDGLNQLSDIESLHPFTPPPQSFNSLSANGGDGDLMLMACDAAPPPLLPGPVNHHIFPAPPQPGLPHLLWGSQSRQTQQHVIGLRRDEEDSDKGDMAFLKDLLSPGPGSSDEFSKEWQDAFGILDSPSTPSTVPSGAAVSANSGGVSAATARPPSNPPSPTGFLPSHLLDHSLSSTGWATPPMFQTPPMQPPTGQSQSAQPPQSAAKTGAPGSSKDMSAWFNLFADLDPLSNPDAIGRSADELLNA